MEIITQKNGFARNMNRYRRRIHRHHKNAPPVGRCEITPHLASHGHRHRRYHNTTHNISFRPRQKKNTEIKTIHKLQHSGAATVVLENQSLDKNRFLLVGHLSLPTASPLTLPECYPIQRQPHLPYQKKSILYGARANKLADRPAGRPTSTGLCLLSVFFPMESNSSHDWHLARPLQGLDCGLKRAEKF